MRLNVERLESRETPAFIPGWAGPETVLYYDLSHDGRSERIAVAGDGGSARVVIEDAETGGTLANFIAFEEEFRGGGYATVSDGMLVIVPGVGGGARMVTFDLPSGRMESYAVPASDGYRGGLQVVAAPNGGVFVLGDSRLMAIDPRSGLVSRSVCVGPGWRFEPSGGWVRDNGIVSVALDRGSVVEWRVSESVSVVM